jgi:ribonuclease BN (tRNA processing enzyme)
MIATTEPRSFNAPSTHLSYNEAARLAKAYGAKDVPNVASYLTQCRDCADADNTIAQLRRNQPQLFLRKRGRQ